MRNDILNKIAIFSLFALLFVLLVHGFASINNDIGRHLRLGEIIWTDKSIPDTNLFSYTEPNFPVENHHWLSEVVFHLVFSAFDITSIIWLKVFLLVAAFVFVFCALPRGQPIWAMLIPMMLSIIILIERSEARPEIFSFLFLAIFLFVLFNAKYSSKYKWLWFLPLVQLLWVNSHIYFFIGPFLFLAFCIDFIVNRRSNQFYPQALKPLVVIGVLIGFASLINPNGLSGALVPFNILDEYGYIIIENQSLSFIEQRYGFVPTVFMFKASVTIFFIAAVVSFRSWRTRIFELIIITFFIYAGFRMLRNIPLYALGSIPVLALFLQDAWKTINKKNLKFESHVYEFISRSLLIVVIVTTLVLAGMATQNKFYPLLSSPKVFGLSVPNDTELAVDFVHDNDIKGPVFNNFDIGGYLIWKLGQPVFVDNRPEAYSVKFFSDVYKQMQFDARKWKELSESYGIQYVLFSHDDLTPWAQAFFKEIGRNPDWPIIYLNGSVVIFAKRSGENSSIVSRFEIIQYNAVNRIEEELQRSNAVDKVSENLKIARFTQSIGWIYTALKFYKQALKLDPNSSEAHYGISLVYAAHGTAEGFNRAINSMKRVIELGPETANNYVLLSLFYINLNNSEVAKVMLGKALKLDPDNKGAEDLLKQLLK